MQITRSEESTHSQTNTQCERRYGIALTYELVQCGEQLPEDGPVKPKHVVIEYDFNGILK
jgi:hypothetical protein